MGRDSKISWTDHTFSPMRGCRHAVLPDGTTSPACAGPDGKVVCYAETMSHRNPRTLGEWGAHGHRAFGTKSYWRQPLAWNEEAAAAGVPARVFCESLGDLFEGRDVDGVEQHDGPRPDYLPHLERLWRLMGDARWLRWLLLTKRTRNALLAAERFGWPATAWAGATVECEAATHRIADLLRIPARVWFLSMEPLVEAVDLAPWLDPGRRGDRPAPTWIIVGGMSGAGAPMLDLDAVRRIVDQCRRWGAVPFVKQLGSAWAKANGSATRAGTDMGEWPDDLRVQGFPDDGLPLPATSAA